MTWKTLLEDVSRQQAMAVVDDIACRLRDFVEERRSPTGLEPANVTSTNLSILSGHAGIAVFFNYLGRVRSDDDAIRLSNDLTRDVVAAVRSSDPGWSFSAGVAGIGWTCAYLSAHGCETETEFLRAVDSGVLRILERADWPASIDLLGGLVGFGIYGSQRLPSDAGRDIITAVSDQLRRKRVRDASGVSWPTPPRLAPRYLQGKLRESYHDLGIAHGMPGVVGLLGSAALLDVPEARDDVEGATSWLLRNLRMNGSTPLLPRFLSPELTFGPAPAGWCYGNPGTALALLTAARTTFLAPLEELAIELARAEAVAMSGAVDEKNTTLCHGAGGLGHLFNRLYQETDESLFRSAAMHWFDEAIRWTYVGLDPFDPNRPSMRHPINPWLLEGMAGLGLALLAASSDVAPDWDAMLGISTPCVVGVL